MIVVGYFATGHTHRNRINIRSERHQFKSKNLRHSMKVSYVGMVKINLSEIRGETNINNSQF